MPDVVDRKTRSRMMAGIKGKNTKPEILIRKALFARGFRYRLHDKSLPGKPDMIFPKYRAIIHIHGCFWHMHDCHLFKWPSTRREFWREKLEGNKARDERNYKELSNLGWRQLTVWECALKGKYRKELADIISMIENWVIGNDSDCTIMGDET